MPGYSLATAVEHDMRLAVRTGQDLAPSYRSAESHCHKHCLAYIQSKSMILNKNITLLAFSLDTRLSAGCEMVAQRMPAK